MKAMSVDQVLENEDFGYFLGSRCCGFGMYMKVCEWVFSKLPFSPLLSSLGFCEELNAQTCNYQMQRWGNNEGRWFTPI